MTQLRLSVLLALVALSGCDQLGIGHKADGPDDAPTEQELKKIHYMSSANNGPQGRKQYQPVEEAKTCSDYELAMRWNRPPNREGGVFHKKLIFLTNAVPADLPKEAEVLLRGTIERADNLTVGGIVWTLKMA